MNRNIFLRLVNHGERPCYNFSIASSLHSPLATTNLLPQQASLAPSQLHSTTYHYMSTFTPSLGEYEPSEDTYISESISKRVAIEMQNRDRQQQEQLRKQLSFQELSRSNKVDVRSSTSLLNPNEILSSNTSTSTATSNTTQMIDIELQNLRIGKKNIKRLITKLTEDYPQGAAPLQITALSLDAIDYCLRLKKQSNTGLHNAIKLLFWLISERTAGNVHATFDTERTLNPLINAGRRRSHPEEFCAVAIEILASIQQLCDDGDGGYSNISPLPLTMMPNLKTYNMVIDSISKSKRKDAITLIHSLLSYMEQTSNSTNNITPDIISYNSLLYAYSQNSSNDPCAAHACETILRALPPSLTDTISYNITMRAWNRSKDKYAPNRAEALLYEMQEHTNYVSYGDDDTGPSIRPNHVSFTTVIDAWGKSKDLDAAERSEELLDLMERLGRQGLEGLKPNIMTYNAVLNAWASSPLPHSARRAERILMGMIERCGNDELRDIENSSVVVPGTISFSICIKAWAHSDERGASTHTLALLQTMLDIDGTSFYKFRTSPDVGTFNMVLRSLANDSDPSKTVHAERLLKQMEHLNLNPDLQTFNQVLRCCCTTRTEDDIVKRGAVRLATQVLLELRRGEGRRGGVKPDPYTFNFFIKVCDRLCVGTEGVSSTAIGGGGEKQKLIMAAFHFCIESGQFSEPVLSILKNTLGVKALRHVLRIENDDHRCIQNLRISDFPSQWSNQSRSGGGGGAKMGPATGSGSTRGNTRPVI